MTMEVLNLFLIEAAIKLDLSISSSPLEMLSPHQLLFAVVLARITQTQERVWVIRLSLRQHHYLRPCSRSSERRPPRSLDRRQIGYKRLVAFRPGALATRLVLSVKESIFESSEGSGQSDARPLKYKVCATRVGF